MDGLDVFCQYPINGYDIFDDDPEERFRNIYIDQKIKKCISSCILIDIYIACKKGAVTCSFLCAQIDNIL